MNALDRRSLFTSGVAAALLAATGVSATGSGPKPGGRLRAALSGALRSDTWGAAYDNGFFMHAATQGAVFDTLTEIGASGALRGELAIRWDGSGDAKTWVFELRQDVEFHNGAAFGSKDVVASFGRHKDIGAFLNLASVRPIGPHRVEIVLHAGNPDLPYLLSNQRLVIYPADHLEQALREGIGTGLYRVKRFVPGQQFLGVRVSTHYKDGQAGWFESVDFVSVPDARVRAQALEGGYVDVADQIDLAGLTGQPSAARVDPHEVETGLFTANQSIGTPTKAGQPAPDVNFRMAERWWFV
jgi:peptide/nickel transport system substrate-binding protein